MELRAFTSLALAVILASAVGCDSKPEDKKADAKAADKKADAKATDAKLADAKAEDVKAADPAPTDGGKVAQPAAGGSVDLTKLGLKAEAPAGTNIGDTIMGEGIMVQGPNLVATVELASDTRPKTEEDAKKEAADYTPLNLKSEKLADGWAVTFDNTGDLGANFFVQVRRDIGGKTYWCETVAPMVEQQTAALDFCKSLKQ